MSVIEDGSGKGFVAKVGSDNRLNTRTVSESLIENATCNGELFFIGTNIITLTSACESGVLYLENTGCENLVIDNSIIQWGPAKDACCVVISSGDYLVKTYFNPTGGTLITCGTCGISVNFNLSSAKTVCVISKVGAEGLTLTAARSSDDLTGEPGRVTLKNNIVIPKGSSIAISFLPPTGTASVSVNFQTFFYKVEDI